MEKNRPQAVMRPLHWIVIACLLGAFYGTAHFLVLRIPNQELFELNVVLPSLAKDNTASIPVPPGRYFLKIKEAYDPEVAYALSLDGKPLLCTGGRCVRVRGKIKTSIFQFTAQGPVLLAFNRMAKLPATAELFVSNYRKKIDSGCYIIYRDSAVEKGGILAALLAVFASYLLSCALCLTLYKMRPADLSLLTGILFGPVLFLCAGSAIARHTSGFHLVMEEWFFVRYFNVYTMVATAVFIIWSALRDTKALRTLHVGHLDISLAGAVTFIRKCSWPQRSILAGTLALACAGVPIGMGLPDLAEMFGNAAYILLFAGILTEIIWSRK